MWAFLLSACFASLERYAALNYKFTMSEPIQSRQKHLNELYFGKSEKAIKFQGWLVLFDIAIIIFFMLAPFMERDRNFYIVDYLVAGILAIDMFMRAFAYGNIKKFLRRPIFWTDLAVLLSLLIPLHSANLGFLRILSVYSLVNSESFWHVINSGKWNDTPIETRTKAVSNFIIFVFFTSAIVHTFFAGQVPNINSFVDSLYFTVTTLSTTGFGDITLPGTFGRILSIAIMIGGVSLFIRLLQVIMRADKVRHECPKCGLMLHDYDAVCCKACGIVLNIRNE